MYWLLTCGAGSLGLLIGLLTDEQRQSFSILHADVVHVAAFFREG